MQEHTSLTVQQAASNKEILVGHTHHLLMKELGLSRVYVQNGYHNYSQMNTKQHAFEFLKSGWIIYWRMQLVSWDYDCRWVLDLFVRSRNETTKHTMGQKRSSSARKSSCHEVRLKGHVNCFFDSRVIIYSHFVPQGHTINASYRISILKQLLHVHILQNRLDYQNGHFKLHHDNVRPHVPSSVLQFLDEKNNVLVIPHLPHSPDLAPATSFCSLCSRKNWRSVVLSRVTLSLVLYRRN